MITTTVNSQASKQYEALLIQLAQAMKAGDKERANVIRREMELPERGLDGSMLDLLDGLSADLYMLDEKEYFERIAPEQAIPQRLVSGLKRAWDNQDWEEVLKLIRKDVPFISHEHRAYLRAVAYEKLGLVRSALSFMDYAALQNPEDVVYPYFGLEYLVKLGENEEAVRRANFYVTDKTTPPVLLIGAAVALIQTAKHLNRADQNKRLMVAMPALVRALSSKEGLETSASEVIGLGYVSLGFCLEALGDTTKADLAYQFALVVDPNNGPAQEALQKHVNATAPPRSTVPTTVPDEASKARPENTSFQTSKARQIWLAAA